MIALTLVEWGFVASFVAAAGVVIQILVHAFGVRGRRKDSERIRRIEKNTEGLLRLEEERERTVLKLELLVDQNPGAGARSQKIFMYVLRLKIVNQGTRPVTIEQVGFCDRDERYLVPVKEGIGLTPVSNLRIEHGVPAQVRFPPLSRGEVADVDALTHVYIRTSLGLILKEQIEPNVLEHLTVH